MKVIALSLAALGLCSLFVSAVIAGSGSSIKDLDKGLWVTRVYVE